MFSSPGSLCMYSTATRGGIVAKDNIPWVGPGSYDPKFLSIDTRQETLPPFDTTAKRGSFIPSGNPSPCDYNPWQRPRYDVGCPLLRLSGERYSSPKDITNSPGPVHKLPDPWLKMLIDIWASRCMKPRVNYEKFVSNNVPTIFHPLELRCFVSGVDGRMYPWRLNRKFRVPGPRYDILTSQSVTPRIVDFGLISKRPPLFRIIPGFGPADFSINRDFNKPLCGTFLSVSHKDPTQSAPRLFDMLVNHVRKTIYPTPFHYSVIRDFERMCPKAVSAPFKSTNSRLQRDLRSPTPAPNRYFDSRKQVSDLDPKLLPRSSPPEPAPFLTTAERFQINYDEYFLPSPCQYTLRGMADDIVGVCKRYAAAIPNPKMGFLVSARQCACFCDKKDTTLDARCHVYCGKKKVRKWRNIRPKNIATYNFWKGIPKPCSSPGPIYDTSESYAAIKGRRSWWDPRSKCETGFLNSGYNRKIVIQIGDNCGPGPKYHPVLPMSFGGRVVRTEPRFVSKLTDSPGPCHKFHEKQESSVWKGTHLGTFNRCLKGIYRQRPSAGGFHPYGPTNNLADELFGIEREDVLNCCLTTKIDC